jgi:ATP-dependent Clp protease adapter protein ClpS
MHSSSSSQSSMTMRQGLSTTTSIEATSSTSSSTQVLEQPPIIIENDTIIKERQQQRQHRQQKQQHIEEQYNNEHDRYHLVLLNDAINTRSYVCRILVEVTALSEAESYARMVHAHEHGEAIIGEYCMEYAEHYKEALVTNGLLCEIIPVTE